MIFFGHLGITMAITRTADKTVINRNPKTHAADIDYRLVLLGAILPDILDKSVLFFISGGEFRSGRMFAHTLLFMLLVFILGLIIMYSYKKSWALILAACIFIHLILDKMWLELNTFLWPFYRAVQHTQAHGSIHLWVFRGGTVPKRIYSNGEIEFSLSFILNLLSDPYYLVSELVGFLILLYFIIILARKKQIISFLKTGRI